MFKLVVFFAILASAFAAPKPDPVVLYSPGIPLSYSNVPAASVPYSPIAYNYLPYASGYYYGGSPSAPGNFYY